MRFILLILTVLFLLPACDSDSPSSGSNNNNNTIAGCLDASYSIWLGVFHLNMPKVHGYCESAVMRRMNAGSWTDLRFTTAKFCTAPEKAGSVEYISVNGIQLDGDSSLYLTTESIPEAPYHRWSFGGGDVPTIYDSIESVREFTVTYPKYLMDTVRKTGFTIKYEPTRTDSVFVYFYYDPELSREYDPTITDTVPTITLPIGYRSTGTTSISPQVFAGSFGSPAFPDRGVMRMLVIAYREKFITAEGKRYLFRTGERCETSFFFKK